MVNIIKRIYTKIDRNLKRAPKRVLNMYNNLISGIVGGAIIYYLITLETLTDIAIGWWYVIVLWLFGRWAIIRNTRSLRSENSKKVEIKNYYWNTIMALLGGFYLLGVFKIGINIIYQILINLVLIIVFISISYFRNKN